MDRSVDGDGHTTTASEADIDVGVSTQDLRRSAADPFYTRLNQILEKHDFDGYARRVQARKHCADDPPKEIEETPPLQIAWGILTGVPSKAPRKGKRWMCRCGAGL